MNNKVQAHQEPKERAGSEQYEAAAEVAHFEISQEAKNMATLCHILGLVGFLGPLIVWLMAKDKDRFIDEQGREAVNYHISLLIYFFIAWLLCFVLVGFLLIPALIVLNIVLVIMAAAKSSDGVGFRYPIAIRFIK